MNAAATPTKRRALGALDVNVARSPASSKLSSGSPLKKQIAVSASRHATPSPPSSRKGSPKKRPLEAVESGLLLPAVKKLCSESQSAPAGASTAEGASLRLEVEDAEDSPSTLQPAATRRSVSPDASSLFDNSTIINTSQLTNITEPDVDAPITTTEAASVVSVTSSAVLDASVPDLPPPRPRRVLTREEFRQRAEILKLRLSLATYKVKTNQTDVPLDELQVRPVPGMAPRRLGTPLPSMSAHTIQRATPAQYWYRSGRRAQAGPDDDEEAEERREEEEEEEEEEARLPELAPGASELTPRKGRRTDDEERLTSSALRGGAAKGLLSLSQG